MLPKFDHSWSRRQHQCTDQQADDPREDRHAGESGNAPPRAERQRDCPESYWQNHQATFTQQVASGNVDIRLGTLRGNGTIAWATQGVCTSDCPPPYYGNPYPGYTRVDGAVIDSKDGGSVHAYGQAPSIQ